MKITILRELPEEDWSNFVNIHPDGNIFHSPEMFKVFSLTKQFQPELWAATENSRPLALLLPVKITLLNGIFRRLTTRSVVFGGILCEETQEGQLALGELLQAYTKASKPNAIFTELRNVFDCKAYQPVLRRHSFIHESHLNYLIHLDRTDEEIFRNIGRRTRKNIRHALKQNKVTIDEVKDKKQVAICYKLLHKTYKAARVPLANISLFESAFDLLYPKGMVRFTLASFDQIPVAVSVDLLFKDIIYGWYGGVDRVYGCYPVHELLMWHVLKWGSQNGYRLYDFGGAGKPHEKYGVRNFKAKFGGEQVDYGRNTYIHSRWLFRLSEKGYLLLRRWL